MSTLSTFRSPLSGGTTLAATDFFMARNRAVLRLLACLDLLRAVGIYKFDYRVAVQSCTAPGVGAALPGTLAVNDRDLAFLPHHRGMEDEIRRLFAQTVPGLPKPVLAAEYALLRAGFTEGFAQACRDVLNRPFQMYLFGDIRDRRLDRPSLADAFVSSWLGRLAQAAEAGLRLSAGRADEAEAVPVLKQYVQLANGLTTGKADGYVGGELDLVEETYTRWAQRKILYVFDFDDTIAVTHSMVGVKNDAGVIDKWVDSAEWANLSKDLPNERFDYSQMKEVVKPEEIKTITAILKNAVLKRGGVGAAICTARSGAEQAIANYLTQVLGVAGVHVQCMNGANKGVWIGDQIEREGYTRICFFDDAEKNINDVRAIRSRYPFVEVYVHRVTSHP